MNVGSSGALGGGGNITFGGGTLQYSTSNTTDYSSRIVNSTLGAITIDTDGQLVTFNNVLAASNTDGLVKLGTGTLSLGTASEAYTGTTFVEGGTLQIYNGVNAIANGTGTIELSNGANLTWTLGGPTIGTHNLTNPIILGTGGGTLTAGIGGSGDYTFSGSITGGTGLTIDGYDAIAIGTTVDNVGTLTVNAQRLLFAGSQFTGGGPASLGLLGNNATVIVNNSTFDIGVGGTQSLANPISFAGTVGALATTTHHERDTDQLNAAFERHDDDRRRRLGQHGHIFAEQHLGDDGDPDGCFNHRDEQFGRPGNFGQRHRWDRQFDRELDRKPDPVRRQHL